MFSLWDRIKYNFKGLDELAIKELQQKVEDLEKLNLKDLSDKVVKLSEEFGKLPEDFKKLSGKFDSLQKNFTGLEKKVDTLTETVADQEKTLLICTIATAVAVIAITSFVAFCIYQGVKLEREKEKNLLDQDTPDAKLSNVGTTDGTEKLQNNLKVANM